MEDKKPLTAPSAQPIDDVKPLPDATSTGAEFSSNQPQSTSTTEPAKLVSSPEVAKAPVLEEKSESSTQSKEPAIAPATVETPSPEQSTAPPASTSTSQPDTPKTDSVSSPESSNSSDDTAETAHSKEVETSTKESNIKDHGTHRSHVKHVAGNPAMAVVIFIVGLLLAGFVVFVYIATN